MHAQPLYLLDLNLALLSVLCQWWCRTRLSVHQTSVPHRIKGTVRTVAYHTNMNAMRWS